MIEKPKRPKKIPNQDNKQPQTIQELIRRYDLDNTKIYDYLDGLVLQMNNKFQTIIDTQKKNLELAFPIGSPYITPEDVNPRTILGFGTWERSKGRVLVGLDENDSYFNEIGKTGGETTHTLTIEEMTEHNHAVGIEYTVATGGDTPRLVSNPDYGDKRTAKTGGSQPFNITQPYEVVGYMWIRRA